LDAVDGLSEIVQSLGDLSRRPTARVVFDEFVPATYYTKAVTEIGKVSYVMGEILDSAFVIDYSVDAYRKRVAEYLDELDAYVDIWEIGNEVNGEWLGDPNDVAAKISAAYALVKDRGARAALTLYYNEKCWSYPWEETFTWAQHRIPEDMKRGLDFVLLSYYEDDCLGLQPDWPSVFRRLAQMFPTAQIGFGEVGSSFPARKEEYIRRYYTLSIPEPHYVGGYFWWYFKQDMVPKSKPLWAVLNEVFAHGPEPGFLQVPLR
jgi:hypothetical protein